MDRLGTEQVMIVVPWVCFSRRDTHLLPPGWEQNLRRGVDMGAAACEHTWEKERMYGMHVRVCVRMRV